MPEAATHLGWSGTSVNRRSVRSRRLCYVLVGKEIAGGKRLRYPERGDFNQATSASR